MKLAGVGKTNLNLKLPIDEGGIITAKLYKSTAEGRIQIMGRCT